MMKTACRSMSFRPSFASKRIRLFATQQDHTSKRVWEVPIDGKSQSKRNEILYTYTSKPNSNAWNVVPLNENERRTLSKNAETFTESIQRNTLQHLLPNGYPESVHAGYTKYVAYSFVASTASTATMVLSTQTLLLAIGVGTAHAAPIAATLNWILKDGIGQFGGILFASKISTSSNSIDADPKRWRMVSSFAMDFAMMLELATPAFPGYFLLIASVANVGKNIAFLTAGASRAKLHQCLSRNGKNLGDITAKATSQSIVASLAGTGIGIGLSPYLLGDLYSVGLGCLMLSSIHEICTYQSLKAVAIDRLNRQRLAILFDLYFQDHGSSEQNEKLVSPESVCKHESFLPMFRNDESLQWLHVGCGITTLAPNGPEEFHRLHQGQEKYILNCQINGKERTGVALSRVNITFMEGACDDDILKGVFQAHAIKAFANGQIKLDLGKGENEAEMVVISSYRYTDEHFSEFRSNLSRAGWIMDDGGSIVLESGSHVRFRFDNDIHS